MRLTLPRILKLVAEINTNEIWQYYGEEITIDNIQCVSTEPFLIESSNINYLLTNNRDYQGETEDSHILLTAKKPTKADLNTGKLKIKRWLKHPLFQSKTPEEILDTWVDKFKFVKENEQQNVKGLRPPQIGALYSILAHIHNAEDKAIIVMPTGTGKTETMLAALVSNCCKKLLVSVPSDSLRSQIAQKFITLGLLKEYGIVDKYCDNPIVGIINSGFDTEKDLLNFIDKCNVVVSTMDLLTEFSVEQKATLNNSFSHFFVDEAHHSEARTWKELINKFDKEKVFLFTATPFRNDGQSLQGKQIFNFPLRKAQEQKYYKKINYLPIREYNKELADKKIAEKAIEQLIEDRNNGYNHYIMARCKDKVRAKEVFDYYKEYIEYNPILVYTGIAGLASKIEAIKQGKHSIIVCVNMLGEGFDLPNLKIAAIHDDRQSLPIALQFIGRFTRTSYEQLGNASFITNIAYPPIHEELDLLYARNSDWNLLLPRLSANATQKEIDMKSFLDRFNNLSESVVPFQEINPAMSTIIYQCGVNIWNPSNWENGIAINNYEHVFSRHSHDTLIIILGKIEKVEWGKFETVKNLQWDLVVVHWDLRQSINRVFLNTSIKGFSGESLLDAIFGADNTTQISGMNVFRIFHNVNRLSLFNVGTRKGIGQDITFQSYYGKGVQDGIKLLEQGTLIKNNIFGIGYKDGEKVSLGCSVKGKIWSYQRGNLDELTKWCKYIGETVDNNAIDPNVVLQHTLAVEKLQQRPDVMPILIDWNSEMYENTESRYSININGLVYDLSNAELNLLNPSIDVNQSLRFSVDTEDRQSVQFEIEIGLNQTTNKPYYKVNKLTNHNCSIQFGRKNENLVDFFQTTTPTLWFADGSQLFGNLFVKLKVKPDVISKDLIIADNWAGVDIGKESQDIAPFIQNSIQYYFIEKIKNDYKIIYDDDGNSEIADIIGINDSDTVIDIHLYHLKYAKKGIVSNNIDNFYQVCGQAEKSLKWKHKDGREFFSHLFKRKTKILNGSSCSRIIKGTENDLENLLNQAKWSKAMKFHIYIVQPSLSKANASDDILLLLGNVQHYLSTVGNIDLKIYTSP